MLDIKFILSNMELVKQNVRDRHVEADVDKVVALYSELRTIQQELEVTRSAINKASGKFTELDDVGKAKLREEVSSLKARSRELEEQLRPLRVEYEVKLLQIPNLASTDTPKGKDDTDNVILRTVGKPRRFTFTPLDHVALGEKLDLLDFATATEVTGPKFYFLKNEAVLLELALIRYALDTAISHGFTPMATPELVKDAVITASGFTPRGPESQIYSIEGSDMSLIGTSEITLGAYMANKILSEDNLPIKFTGLSHCFRTEAGGAGRLNKGLYRVHQFSKVELYEFSHPEESTGAHERMLALEEDFYQSLNLPYQVMAMCSGDLGAPAYKKYDIEAWMPFIGDAGGYGEVTSTSNCTDFQARRLNVKFKDGLGKKHFVHTLNGTVVAVTRTMLAILENNQQRDGSVRIPKVLQPYMGMKTIRQK